jgi:hypothetical protein
MTEVCSGDEPCLEGILARAASFSTCMRKEGQYERMRQKSQQGKTYGNLKIHHLLRKCAHLVVETEFVLSNIVCGEDEVALTFLCTIENDLVSRTGDFVVDIERTARLYLFAYSSVLLVLSHC